MSEENTAAVAEADQNTAEEIHNTSLDEYAQRRLGTEAQAEEPTEVSEEVVDTTSSEENVLSQLDINNLSEGELKELADKLGSRAVARFGEMTAARKAAEEKAARLEAALQNNNVPTKTIKDNPFSDLDTIEKIQSKSEEIEQTIEWAEGVLFESDDYKADDVVTEVDGQDLTKKEIRKALLNARKAQKDYLPDQLNKLQKRLQGAQIQQTYDQQARQELDWLKGEDNVIRQNYFATLRDPKFAKLKEILNKELPDVSGRLEYMFAHAANSIYGRKPLETKGQPKKDAEKAKRIAALIPTKTGSASVAKSEKPTNKRQKALKDLQTRFQKTGNPRDFAEMRKIQMQNR